MEPSLLTITFDDGLRCQFESALPILTQYRLPATFFLIANSDPLHEGRWPKIDWGVIDQRNLKEMVVQGHEMGSHSVTHGQHPHREARSVLEEGSVGETKDSKLWIEDRLSVEVESYSYPYYYATDAIKSAVIGAGYKQARRGKQDFRYSPKNHIDWFDVDCRELGGDKDVCGWLQPGLWHVLTFHGIGTDDDGWSPVPVDQFAKHAAELAELRDSGALEVLTFNDAAKRLRGT
jgi:peptidoglycan/xylan/chitin deacetylase (PgdA/CDA1 family)